MSEPYRPTARICPTTRARCAPSPQAPRLRRGALHRGGYREIILPKTGGISFPCSTSRRAGDPDTSDIIDEPDGASPSTPPIRRRRASPRRSSPRSSPTNGSCSGDAPSLDQEPRLRGVSVSARPAARTPASLNSARSAKVRRLVSGLAAIPRRLARNRARHRGRIRGLLDPLSASTSRPTRYLLGDRPTSAITA